jgi:large subunit ribosomal protein L3
VKEAETLKRGDMITLKIFAAGDRVQVTGMSKGKGFQGVVKRHGFRGGPRTHGHKDNLRMPGTIGAGGVQRVFKNQRMGGHMGSDHVTVKNLEIVQVDPTANLLYIKGALPGARGSLLLLSSDAGTIKVEMPAMEEAIAPAAERAAGAAETIPIVAAAAE